MKEKVKMLILLWSHWHTCECLAEACEVEELTFGHGEQLNKEDQEWDGGEDHRQDHKSLDGLQPVWEWREEKEGKNSQDNYEHHLSGQIKILNLISFFYLI